MVSSQVIVDHADYRIELTVPDQVASEYEGKLLVGFGEIGSSLDGKGFGQELAGKLGIAYAAVKQRALTQYQFLPRTVVTEALSGLGYELFFYGTSIGGYCAAYYARPLGAHFLALSPRVPAHPVTKRRLAIDFTTPGYKHEALYEGPGAGRGRHVILLDRGNGVDDFYLRTDLSIAYGDLEVHDVAGAGHYTPRTLLLSGALKSTVVSFLRGEEIEIVLDNDAVIAWNEERVYSLIDQKRFGHAIEHIEVLLRFQRPVDIERHVRALNAAISASPAETRASGPGQRKKAVSSSSTAQGSGEKRARSAAGDLATSAGARGTSKAQKRPQTFVQRAKRKLRRLARRGLKH